MDQPATSQSEPSDTEVFNHRLAVWEDGVIKRNTWCSKREADLIVERLGNIKRDHNSDTYLRLMITADDGSIHTDEEKLRDMHIDKVKKVIGPVDRVRTDSSNATPSVSWYYPSNTATAIDPSLFLQQYGIVDEGLRTIWYTDRKGVTRTGTCNHFSSLTITGVCLTAQVQPGSRASIRMKDQDGLQVEHREQLDDATLERLVSLGLFPPG